MSPNTNPPIPRWMLLLLPAVFLIGLGLAYWFKSSRLVAAQPEAVPVTIGQIEMALDQRVSLEGYLDLPDREHNSRPDYLLLYDRQPHAPFDRYVVAFFKVSQTDRPNSMRPLPEVFIREDLYLTADDGRPVQAGDHVRLTGWARYKFLDCERVSLDEVDTIELLP